MITLSLKNIIVYRLAGVWNCIFVLSALTVRTHQIHIMIVQLLLSLCTEIFYALCAAGSAFAEMFSAWDCRL